ncbi:MAG: four helix bundle protein [Treponema sp.]|nr:four helix bundle protein [Treponema sp.]
MNKDETAMARSKRFAIKIVGLYKYLTGKKEFVLGRQILRCGTSIGANLAEAECAISKRDFLAKVYISLKECSETIFWLDLLYETNFILESEYADIKNDCEILRRILSATTTTLRKEGKKEGGVKS